MQIEIDIVSALVCFLVSLCFGCVTFAYVVCQTCKMKRKNEAMMGKVINSIAVSGIGNNVNNGKKQDKQDSSREENKGEDNA